MTVLAAFAIGVLAGFIAAYLLLLAFCWYYGKP